MRLWNVFLSLYFVLFKNLWRNKEKFDNPVNSPKYIYWLVTTMLRDYSEKFQIFMSTHAVCVRSTGFMSSILNWPYVVGIIWRIFSDIEGEHVKKVVWSSSHQLVTNVTWTFRDRSALVTSKRQRQDGLQKSFISKICRGHYCFSSGCGHFIYHFCQIWSFHWPQISYRKWNSGW